MSAELSYDGIPLRFIFEQQMDVVFRYLPDCKILEIPLDILKRDLIQMIPYIANEMKNDYGDLPGKITLKKFKMFVDLQLKADFFLENSDHCFRDTGCTRLTLFLSIFAIPAREKVEVTEKKMEEDKITEGKYLEEMNRCKKIYDLQQISIFNCPLIVHKDIVKIYMLTSEQCTDLCIDVISFNENV